MRPRSPGHVLLTSDAVGGVWTYALDLSRGLLARGTGVTVAVLGPSPSPDQLVAAAAIEGLKLVHTGLPLDWMEEDPARLAEAGRSLAELASAERVDLVHLNSPALAAEASFSAPVVGGCHSCLATWWTAVRGAEEMPSAFQWRTEQLARGYAACDRLIAPSLAFARATRERYGVTLETVHNGRAAPPPFASAEREATALTSGRLWDEGKNMRTLDRAAGRMRHRVRAAGSLSSPDGPVPPPERLEWLGQLDSDTLRRELERSAVFVSLALYEPFGLGVLEAAQAGCALVLSDIPTLRELWDGAAIFVPPLDDSAAAQALDELLEDVAASAALGRAAALRAKRFDLGSMTDGVVRVYGRAAADRVARTEAAA